MVISFGGGYGYSPGYLNIDDNSKVFDKNLIIYSGYEIDAIKIGDYPKVGGSGGDEHPPVPLSSDGSIILQAIGSVDYKLVYISLQVVTEGRTEIREYGDRNRFFSGNDVNRLVVDNFKVSFNFVWYYPDHDNQTGRVAAIRFNFNNPNQQKF